VVFGIEQEFDYVAFVRMNKRRIVGELAISSNGYVVPFGKCEAETSECDRETR